MTVALIVTSDVPARRLLTWAWQLAQLRETDLVVIRAQQRKGDREWSALQNPAEIEKAHPGSWALLNEFGRQAGAAIPMAGPAGERPTEDTTTNWLPTIGDHITFRKLQDADPDQAIRAELAGMSVNLLILPLAEPPREGAERWEGRLYRAAPCRAVLLRPSATEEAEPPRKILVPTGGGDNAKAALRLGMELAEATQGQVTALYVEPQVGEDALLVGQRELNRVVRAADVRRGKEVQQKVVVANDVLDGVRAAVDATYDLVLLGASRDRTIRRFLLGGNEIFSGEDAPAFAAVRAGYPFRTRFQRCIERNVRAWVPQLGREERVKLVDRVHTRSQWEFDFVALTALSTLLATLGLIGNQAPVVIGAMLVAPLMTPLIGSGLALVQGNLELVRSAILSVTFGFMLALFVGWLIGVLVPMGSIPPQILNRTSPSALDLAVAFVGGIAASYAISRPNLSSALPGVAIAASLVPPIASCGVSIAHREWAFAFGALLLFLTNIVAIVLGAACSLWAVGIRDTHDHGASKRWSRLLGGSLCVAVFALGFIVSHRTSADAGSQLDGLQERLQEVVSANGLQGRIVEVRKTSRRLPLELNVVLETPREDLDAVADRVCEAVAEYYAGMPVNTRLEVHRVFVRSQPVKVSSETAKVP